MKHLFVLFLALFVLPLAVFVRFKRITLGEALASKEVTVTAVNFAGDYKGKTTRLTITNQSKNELGVVVDLGTILKPADSINQPMILAQETYVLVLPSATRQVEVMTFCGNQRRHSPKKGSEYAYWKVAGDTLREVLRFANTYRLDGDVTQEAVWVLTNNAPVSCAYHPDPAIRAKLTDMLVKYTGQPRPEYYTINEVPPAQYDQPLSVRKALKIMADFKVPLEEPAVLTLGVYNDKNEMIQKVFEKEEFRRAIHNFSVEFALDDAPPGKYYIRLTDNTHTLKEQMVEVK